MPLLQVRNCPTPLYETISLFAKKENRSIAQETISILQKNLQLGFDEKKSKRIAAIEKSVSLNFTLPEDAPSPTDLIREDRNR